MLSRNGLIALMLATASPALAGDKIEFDFGGKVQYDLRFRPIKYTYGSFYSDPADPATLSRNELIGKFKLGVKYGKFGMKSDLDFVLRAYPRTDTLTDLYDYNAVTPFRFEAHSLYLYGSDLLVKGFDLRIGQQKALFGVGDQFNPTNTINPYDFEDVLLFGDQIGNLMVRMDYTPAWNWQITGILVPIFKPALLPRTSHLAQTPDRYPFTDPTLRHNLAAEQDLAMSTFGYPTVVRDVRIQQPDFTPENMQGFFRVGATLGGQDIALSYYRGRSDIPQPTRNLTEQVDLEEPLCETDPTGDTECIDGYLFNDVTLEYPRIHVVGLNMAGEINPFGKVHKSFKALGYRLEVGLFIPEEETNTFIDQGTVHFDFPIFGTTVPVDKVGEYPYPNGKATVVEQKPFVKWVLGLDYTFNKYVYMNTQWVHGFPDEFGSGAFWETGTTTRASGIREGVTTLDCVDIETFTGVGETCASEWLKPKLGDYLVWGTDLRFLSNSALLRLFFIWDMIGVYEETWDPDAAERVRIHHGPFSEDGFSLVFYPKFEYNFGNGLDMSVGALLQFGKPWSKFGAAENGGHQIFTQARYRF